MILVLIVIAVLNAHAWEHDAFSELSEIDESIYSEMDNRPGFESVSRITRQVNVGGAICVPAGTCITTGTGNTGTIDPRIVTPGVTSPPIPANCPPGQVSCSGISTGSQCGQRYVPTVNTIDGPSTYGAYPWQAYIMNQTGYTGSGVLVDAYHVLTAAHKVNLNAATPGNIRVYMGVHDPRTTLANAQFRTVVRVQIHPSFDPATLKHDIAVLRLSAPIALGYQVNIGTACMPATVLSGDPYAGQNCIVSGWGMTRFAANDAPTSPQKQVTVPIVNYATCRTAMSAPTVLGTNVDRFLDVNEICAGGQANRDACTQDGGSPLVCLGANGRYNVVGLVIWGKRCGEPNVYGVYVDVSKYRAWIDSTIATLNAG